MTLRKLGSEDRTLVLASIIALVILLLFHLVFLKPHIYRLGQLNLELSRLTRDVENTARDGENIANLKNRLEDLKAKVSFYEQKMSREKDIPALLRNLSKIAKDSQVKIVEIQPRGGRDVQGAKGMYLEVPIDIKARCGYHQLGRFINELENDPRFMRVSDIEIKGTPRDYRNHNVRLLLNMFVLK